MLGDQGVRRGNGCPATHGPECDRPADTLCASLAADEVSSRHSPEAHSSLSVTLIDVLHSRVIIKTKSVKVLHDAIRLLKSAQLVFSKTDDHITTGNILTFLALAAKRGPHEGTEWLVGARREFRRHGGGPLPGEARAIRHRVKQLQEEMHRPNAKGDYQLQPVHKKVGDHLMSQTIELGPRLLAAAEEVGMASVSQKFSKLLKECRIIST